MDRKHLDELHYTVVSSRAVKRLIASKIKVCVYITYVGAMCIIILYI